MKRLLTLSALFLCSLLTFAQFSGSGSGTESDPYLILNPIQLNQLRNFLNQSGVYFKLMADIDLTEYLEDENPSQGWQPVGSSSSSFKGILDGNGKTVSGLWINRGSNDYVGFFSNISGATIKNLKVVATTISGKERVGGISGNADNSTISDCEFSGNITGSINVGGYVGYCGNNMTLSNAVASVSITATGNNVGGFVGTNNASTSFTMSNCSLNDGKIVGTNYVGGCCGNVIGTHSTTNSISNTFIHADITGNDYVGGICGNSENSNHTINLSSCGFMGKIQANSYVGGLVGRVKKTDNNRYNYIQKSFAIGSISATGQYVGGLIGYDEGHSTSFYLDLSDCYYSGSISGSNCVGGLIGYKKYGFVEFCYAVGAVAGTQYVGGLIGSEGSYTTLQASVAINTRVTATVGNVGRITGYSESANGTMGTSKENKSWNRTIVISQGVAQEITDNQQHGTGVSATTLKLKATYVAMGWDFTDTWAIQETESYPYMQLQTAPPVITSQVVSGATIVSGKCVDGGTIILEIDGEKQQQVASGNSFSFTVSPLQAGHEVRLSAKADGKEQSYFTTQVVSFLGKGTENDPYQISTAADLTQVYRKGYYKLMNDVDLTNYINQYYSSEGWESIGRDGSETICFDGDGHKVTGLWCNSTRDNTGLFSCFANGYIKNLTVETANGKQVKGGANTGILIGKMINGTIENCRVSGNIADGTPVGGFVGLMDNGNILKCQANVTINTTGAKSYVGGLVGEITAGTIDQCYSNGTLTATGSESYVGGLVGKNSSAISNCYSDAAVSSSYNAAGLVAYNYDVVEKSYSTGNLYSNNYAAGVIGYNDGANAVVRNCAAMNNKIDVVYESQQIEQGGGYGQRIIGGIKNGAPAPELNNYALNTMQVSVNDVAQKVYDDIMNGVAKTQEELINANTYKGIGWDFEGIWKMPEDSGYPVLQLGSDGDSGGGNTGGGDDEPQTESFSVSTVKVMTGKQQEVSIALDNESEIIMIEFEMQLPTGTSIAKDEDDEFMVELVSNRIVKSHTLEVADKGNGKYKFLLYSSNNSPLKGNSGDLIRFTISCDENVTEGTYQATVESILMADVNEKAISLNDFTFDITVFNAIPGDVNDDGKINGLDIVKIVGYIMGSPTQPFNEAAADLNEDGVINGLDLVKEVSLVLAQTSTTSAGAKAIKAYGLSTASQLTLESHKQGVLTLGTDDNREFIFSQMIIETVGDVTVNNITTDARHIVAFSKICENSYAVVCYSMTNEAFDSNSEIIDIHYTGNGNVNLVNTLFIDREENEVNLGSASFGSATDIKGIGTSVMKPADVYSVTGKLVKKGAVSLSGLPTGIYIVNGQKINIK